MRIRLLAVTLATTLTGALVSSTGATAAPPRPLIIGGETVSSAPWAAAILTDGQFICSGTIISATWVLTARHCVMGTMSVRVGSVYRQSGGTTRDVTQAYGRYDLALLELESGIATTYMPLSNAYPPVGSTNSIYGWGMTCYRGCDAAPVLKTASVRVTTTNTTDYYGGRAIGSYEISGNAWRGDSGGPQVYNGAQVGVASTADGQARQYYSSVAYNRSWIRSISGV